MIAISITNYNDNNLAKALINELDKEMIYVHFQYEVLLDAYGEKFFKYGCDVDYLLMHSHNFNLFITFSAPPNTAQLYNFRLVSFFNEINVQTIEMQHGLFQYGYNFLDNFNRCGFNKKGVKTPEGWGLPIQYPAKNFIGWLGEDGIGYLKSEYLGIDKNNFLDLFDNEYTLIVTNNNWHIYDEYDRINLINGLVKLFNENKNDFFVWKPHPAEYSLEFYNILLSYQIKNLYIFDKELSKNYSAEKLIKNAKFGISMFSTTLIDFDFSGVPTIVYKRQVNEEMFSTFNSVDTFDGSDELILKYNLMKNAKTLPLNTGVKKLDKALLLKKLADISQLSNPIFNSRTILDYLNMIKLEHSIEKLDIDLYKTEVNTISIKKPESKYSVEELLLDIEEGLKNNKGLSARDVNSMIVNLDKVHERFLIAQRSTLGYKVKRFFKKVRKK